MGELFCYAVHILFSLLADFYLLPCFASISLQTLTVCIIYLLH